MKSVPDKTRSLDSLEQSASIHPELPLGRVDSYRDHRAHSPQRQMANVLVVQLLAMLLASANL